MLELLVLYGFSKVVLEDAANAALRGAYNDVAQADVVQ